MRKSPIILLLFFFVSTAVIPSHGGEGDSPANIILFIGDGMGVSQITAAGIVEGVLNLERFETMGLLTTYSELELITDSAAGATAMATGHKTYNGAISVSSEREPLKTVVEYAEEIGKATGLVVTSSVTDATPAVFAAHIDSRKKENEIAGQIAASGIDVLFGGGWARFVPESVDGSRRKDDRDLIAELEKRMKVVRTAVEIREFEGPGNLAALFAPGDPPDAAGRSVTLAELTEKAIGILSGNSEGFFLMVEGAQIDWAGHDRECGGIIVETIDFDDAVGVGLDFAEKDGRTLVIVTSDHETGGFAVHGGSVEDGEVTASGFTTDDHTAGMVPVFAFGPGSPAFGGIHDNTVVGKIMIEYMLDNGRLH